MGNLTDTSLRPNVQGTEEWRTEWGTLETLHSDQMFRAWRSGGPNGEPYRHFTRTKCSGDGGVED